MNVTTFLRTLSTVGVFTLLLAAPLCAMAVEPVDQTLEMPVDGQVKVVNIAGEVNIESWDEPRAHVKVDPGESVDSIEVTAKGGGIQVVVHSKENARTNHGSKVFLRVPRQANIEVQGVSSDISVDGAEGKEIILESVSGNVEVEASVETARLKSVSGHVDFEGSAGQMSAGTVSGDIELEGVRGEVTGSTVSGDIVIQAGRVSRMALETVSGDADVELVLEDHGSFEGTTMSGDLDVSFPAGQEAQFSAQTFSGDIRSDFGHVEEAHSGSGGVLNHREGSNDARVSAESFSGDISLRSR